MMIRPFFLFFVSLLALLSPTVSYAADAPILDGAILTLWWCVPFIGILLSIALCPIFASHLWHHHYGKIILFWTVIFLIPLFFSFGWNTLVHLTAHALLEEYIPFLLLLWVLFTVSGGILIQGHLQGTPKFNVCMLLIGTVLASLMGTTGAAMLLIRPLLKANRERKHRVHTVIFFIFLVANIGGGLTPLGDPPLFLGFLKGVDFFWTVEHMALPVLLNSVLLLILYFFIDSHFYKKENVNYEKSKMDLKLYGRPNIILLILVVAGVLFSGSWKSGYNITLFGTDITLENILRDLLFIVIVWISLKITPKQVRAGNEFNWEPIVEVAKLFIGIFITIVPVIAILNAGTQGQLSIISEIVTQGGEPHNVLYFWFCGVLSGFLDNAPTYLVFFNLASGDAMHLMHDMSMTLLAISMGSVFMGALTYIGNAPNLMVRNIAQQSNVKMPSFIGYMKWSFAILIPIFIIDTVIFFVLMPSF